MNRQNSMDRQLKDMGFIKLRESGHAIYRGPRGGMLVVSRTLNGGRNYQNAIAKAKRMVRDA